MGSFENRRKFFVLILLLKVFTSIVVSEAKEVSCETFNDMKWSRFDQTLKTCLMDEKTSINETGVTISPRNETIKGLFIVYNSEIFYLPDNVAGSFPNLEGYDAHLCSLKTISKRNFNGLIKLQALWLSENQIETIASDTFEGLVELKMVDLLANKIKFIDGGAFRGLMKLEKVNLDRNVCINESFVGSMQIATLQQTVNEKCGLEEVTIITSMAIKPTLAVLVILFYSCLMFFAN